MHLLLKPRYSALLSFPKNFILKQPTYFIGTYFFKHNYCILSSWNAHYLTEI